MFDNNDDLSEIQDAFLNEVVDLLVTAEENFLQLEQDSANPKPIEMTLRIYHNIKGSSTSVGFEQLNAYCHAVESLLVLAKTGKLRLEPVHLDLLIKANDKLKGTIECLKLDKKSPFDPGDIVTQINVILNGPADGAKEAEVQIKAAEAVEAPADINFDERLRHDFFSDATDQLEVMDSSLILLEQDGHNKDAINSLFRAFHTMKSAAGILNFKAIESLAHDVESVMDRLRGDEAPNSEAITAACSEAIEVMRNSIELMKQTGAVDDSACREQCETLRKRFTGLTLSEEIAAPVASPLKEESAPTAGVAPVNAGTVLKDGIKVDPDRLDRLIDAIGELVIAEAMVSQSEQLKGFNSGQSLFNDLRQMNKITRTLQQIGMSLRLVPVRPVFKKMGRIVRDVSKKLGKQVDFEMSGDDIELDKTVFDKIGDPLVHMVRNSVDHGIEKTVEERLRAGKPATAHVTLRAFHKNGSTCIEVEDDGRGLNRAVILAKAIEKGLVREGSALSDREIYALIFQPGFSTAEAVTDVSGRGVGLDVVKKNIDAIHGQIEIKTELGKGTIFSIRIPNTLAIIEGMVVLVGRERYVVPTHSIVRSVKPTQKDIITIVGEHGEMVDVKGELIPLMRMGNFYKIADAEKDPTRAIVLVVEEEGRRLGMLVDRIDRQQQFVTKSLGDFVRNVPGVSGGTIMPDGQVGLILDVGTIMKDLNQ